jgi:hypothetical protein
MQDHRDGSTIGAMPTKEPPMSFPSRRLTAASFLVAGGLTFAGLAATPWEPESTPESFLTTIGSHPTQGQIAAVLLHFGYLAFVPAVFGLIAALSEYGGKLRALGGTLAAVGWIGLPGLLVTDFYAIAMYDKLSVDQAVAVEEAAGALAGAKIVTLTAAIPALIGLSLLVVAAARARLVHAWVPAAVFGGWVVTFVWIGLAGAIAGSSILMAGLIALALGVLRGERPREVTAPAPEVALAR